MKVSKNMESDPSIKPGDLMTLFEKLGIRYAATAAAAQLTGYIANRSVALLLRPKGGLWVGSGVCFQIGGRYFVATAGHNLQHDGEDLQNSDIEVRARGEKFGEALNIKRMGRSSNLDLAWLELDPSTIRRPALEFVAPDETANLPADVLEPCALLGYPASLAEVPSDAHLHPLLSSASIVTLSIPPSHRRSTASAETFAIEWPPHEGSLDDGFEPHGVSGGGVWLLPRHDDYLIWSPERARLIGIEIEWARDSKELVVIRFERWLELVANDLPELRDDVVRVTAGSEPPDRVRARR